MTSHHNTFITFLAKLLPDRQKDKQTDKETNATAQNIVTSGNKREQNDGATTSAYLMDCPDISNYPNTTGFRKNAKKVIVKHTSNIFLLMVWLKAISLTCTK